MSLRHLDKICLVGRAKQLFEYLFGNNFSLGKIMEDSSSVIVGHHDLEIDVTISKCRQA